MELIIAFVLFAAIVAAWIILPSGSTSEAAAGGAQVAPSVSSSATAD